MISKLISLVLLTALWSGLFSTLDWRAIAFGALVSAVILWWVQRLTQEPKAPMVAVPRPIGVMILVPAFFWELIKSAASVVREVYRPKITFKSGVLAYPLEVRSELEITVLASLISLTPGTLSLEVSADRSTLYIHALSVGEDGGESIKTSIRNRLECQVLRAFGNRPRRS